MALILPYHAKPEQVEYTRKYQAERRRRLRNDYFADKSCIKCGSGIFLELHHRKRTTRLHTVIYGFGVKSECEMN
jgi:hypothetical protein